MRPGLLNYKIVPALRLNWDEVTSRPKTPPPDLTEMNDSELKRYNAAERARQAEHKAACEQIVHWRIARARLKRTIRLEADESTLSELEMKLEQAEKKLKLARKREKNLRA